MISRDAESFIREAGQRHVAAILVIAVVCTMPADIDRW
jgi:hypothetical protein